MALKGNLSDIHAADLIQLNCNSGSRAQMLAINGSDQLYLYFDGGQIVHANGRVRAQTVQGPDAVYALLMWDQGTFEVQQGVEAPERTVQQSWSSLLMEGLRRKDESQLEPAPEEPPANPLAEMLHQLAAASSFEGMMVISRDGAILAAELPGQMDQARVGAVAAGILSLSRRSVGQLSRGDLTQLMVQGAAGNIIITQCGPNAAFVALSDAVTSMGMAFLEAQENALALADCIA